MDLPVCPLEHLPNDPRALGADLVVAVVAHEKKPPPAVVESRGRSMRRTGEEARGRFAQGGWRTRLGGGLLLYCRRLEHVRAQRLGPEPPSRYTLDRPAVMGGNGPVPVRPLPHQTRRHAQLLGHRLLHAAAGSEVIDECVHARDSSNAINETQ